MAKKVKIGIIGCGNIGNTHADAYAKVENAEIVAVCDILPERANAMAEKHKVKKVFTDYKKLLADKTIEGVSICVPNDMHAPIAIDAFNAGKNVLLEKPMTLSAAYGKKILQARDKSGKLLQMGMVVRQSPEAAVIKDLIEKGRLGKIYQIRIKLIRQRGIPGLGGWFTTKKRSGGGALIDIAVHFLDLSMWLTNLWKPTRVSAKTYSKFGSPIKDYHYVSMWAGPPDNKGTFDVDDYAAGFIRFGKQATLSFEVAWACNSAPESTVEILGDKGGVKYGGEKTVLMTEMDGRLAEIALDYPKTQGMFVTEMQKFADAVQGKIAVPATGEEGLVTMKLLDAIYKSSETDREVEID